MLKSVDKRLAKFDKQFLNKLDDLLKRNALTEAEFSMANEADRSQKEEVEAKRDELLKHLKRAGASDAIVQRIPQAIKTFVEAFQLLEPATIYKDRED